MLFIYDFVENEWGKIYISDYNVLNFYIKQDAWFYYKRKTCE